MTAGPGGDRGGFRRDDRGAGDDRAAAGSAAMTVPGGNRGGFRRRMTVAAAIASRGWFRAVTTAVADGDRGGFRA